jgi:hypothetical protein
MMIILYQKCNAHNYSTRSYRVLCKLEHLPEVVYYIHACKHCGTEVLLHMAVQADRGLLRDRTDFSVIRYIKDTAGRSIHRASAKCIPSIQGA